MISLSSARITLWVAAAVTLYLALTPGPAGAVIEDGTVRHMLAFLALPWLMMIAYPRLSSWWILAISAVFGGGIELAQLWMAVGRHGDWGDFALDVATAGAAIAIGVVVRRRMRWAV
jgi:glycopeptide antibiotics resistance protein